MMFTHSMLLVFAAQILTAQGQCTYDETNPSPTDLRSDFCSSYITDHCAAVTSLDPEKVTSYCGCLLSSETGTVMPVGNGTVVPETTISSGTTQAPATRTTSAASESSASTSDSRSTEDSSTQSDSSDPSSLVSKSTQSNSNSTTPGIQTGETPTVTDASTFTQTPGDDSSSTPVDTLTSQPLQDGGSTVIVTSPGASQTPSGISSVANGNGTTSPSDPANSHTTGSGVSGSSSGITPLSSVTSANSTTPTASSDVSSKSPNGSAVFETALSNSTITASNTPGEQSPPIISTPAGNGTNGTATWTWIRFSTPSDAGVSATQTPVTIPGNVSVVTESSSTRHYHDSSRSFHSSPTSSTPSSHPTWAGWNGTSTWTRNDTRTPSGTPPTRSSNGTFIPVTGTITGSATTVGGISVVTTFTTPLSPLSSSDNSPNPGSSFAAANFTSATRTAAVSSETCYQLAHDPQGDAPRRALMHNAKLREQNATIPVPYIESVDFESDGVDPLYLTVRDTTESTHFLDISNKSQIAIVDRDGTSMKLDGQGIHFSTDDCRYDISITIKDFLKQLAALSGVECSTGARLRKRLFDVPFTQTVVLHDQCGKPVDRSLRSFPSLSVGSSECTDTSNDGETGVWEFECMFPGSKSGTLQCQGAIKNDVVEFLTTDPFGGACPDLSTVITTLGTTGKDFLSGKSLRDELFKQDFTDKEEIEANEALDSYQRLWLVLQELFAKNDAGNSALEKYLTVYNNYRDLPTDVCEDIHATEIPLSLSLRAGASRFVINTLNFAPERTVPRNVTVQDPDSEACCAAGSLSDDEDDEGTCDYPARAYIGESGCVCGRTAGGDSIAFQSTECDNFVGECDADRDCAEDGHAGFVCMMGTCCGKGVCVDPYACSENSTELVTYKPLLF